MTAPGMARLARLLPDCHTDYVGHCSSDYSVVCSAWEPYFIETRPEAVSFPV